LSEQQNGGSGDAQGNVSERIHLAIPRYRRDDRFDRARRPMLQAAGVTGKN
jgi:hypothetical protein